MTILLTGATGFLGSNLLKKLYNDKHKVIILKRSSSKTWRIDNILSNVISYDIDKEPIERAFKDQKIDIVIHTATSYGRNKENISNIVDTNLMFSLKLLETAIFFNTDTFINTDTFFNTDTLSYKYLSHYALSKKQFVEWLKYFSNKIQVVNLKIEHMYGINDDNSKFVTWITNQMLNNVENIDLTEGKQKRDFIYIDDVVEAYMKILETTESFQEFSEFDVGTGRQITIKDFVTRIYDKIKETKNIKTKLNFGEIPYRDGEFMEIEENVEPLYKLGWEPKFSLEEGISMIINGENND